MNRLICSDVLEALEAFDTQHFKCLIADPPDNIGLGYDEYDDRKSYMDYKQFLADCIDQFTFVAEIVWISFNAKWIFEMGEIVDGFLYRARDMQARLFIQTFTEFSACILGGMFVVDAER